ncbi:hypothetical protein [Streptomyces sp. NPDC006691]|uniref:hypothetical protein n=1 Tax=Streptomyces sp. NPDC006691 TaxID=3364757 RepID=UPI0036AA8D5B
MATTAHVRTAVGLLRTPGGQSAPGQATKQPPTDGISMLRLLAAVALITAALTAAPSPDPCDRYPHGSYAYADCEARQHWS